MPLIESLTTLIKRMSTYSDAEPKADVTAKAYLHTMRLILVDRIWAGLVILAAISIPSSIARSLTTGWLTLYSIHLGIGVAIVVLHLMRKWIPFAFKAAAIMLMFWIVGITGLFTLGLVGSGMWWLAVSSLIMSMLFSIKAGFITILCMFVIGLIAALCFSTDVITPHVDVVSYVRSPAAWINLMIATTILPIIVFQAVAGLFKTTIELLHKIEKQGQEIERLAKFDKLTNIPTLALGMDRLEQALLSSQRSGKKVALLFIDLDRFKIINDTHGHEVGDIVLVQVTERFRKVIRADDTIARIGGDEFIAILQGIEDEASALSLAQNLVERLAEPIEYMDQPLNVGASIGVSIYPDHAQDAKTLMRAADLAMYRAKNNGRSQTALATAA